MSNYTKATNFATKDTLPTGDSNKIVKGTEIDNEFNSISSAISSKADTASPTFTGTPAAPTATTGANTTQLATTAFVNSERTATATLTNKTLTSPTISGGSISGITDLAVADGGTGRSTLTANEVLIGNGTSGINSVAPGTSGNVLTSDGTTWVSSTPATIASQLAKAWVNFAGSDGTRNSSFNVSSVTRTSTGNYTVTFTTAMPNANYSIVGSANRNGAPTDSSGFAYFTQSTGSCGVTAAGPVGGAFIDATSVSMAVFSS
jgi:hypothetical protein